MKTQFIILTAGALLMSSSSIFAGQDYSQTVQIQRAMETKQKMELARRQAQESPSVAGAKGEQGKLGPTSITAPNYGCIFRNQRSSTCANTQ